MSGFENAQEGLEHAHHAAHHHHEHHQHHPEGHPAPKPDNHPVLVGVLVGGLAVVLALTEAAGRTAAGVYMTDHIAISDTWAFYQAKNERQTTYLVGADVLESMPNQTPETAKRVAMLRADAARMDDDPKGGEGRKQLAERAARQTQERDHADHVNEEYETSAGILQISIVLASVSIVAKIKPLSIVAGLIGLGAAAFSLMVYLGAV